MTQMLTNHALQLIAEGSSKLASVPSGGAGAPAAGGAAAGGAAAAEAVEEKKEEGKPTPTSSERHVLYGYTLTPDYREGGVRRRHGIRSLRLNALTSTAESTSRMVSTFRRCLRAYHDGLFHAGVRVLGISRYHDVI